TAPFAAIRCDRQLKRATGGLSGIPLPRETSTLPTVYAETAGRLSSSALRRARRRSTTMATRIEKDFLGQKEIPGDAYYGVQTLRGKENFHITGIPMSLEPQFVKAFGYVKKAAAMANRDLGVLDAKIANAIIAACDRLIAGEMRDQFVTDFIQGGAGTSTN